MSASELRTLALLGSVCAVLGLLCSNAQAQAQVGVVQADATPDMPRSGAPAWRAELYSDLLSDPLPLRHFGQDNWADHVRARPGRNLVQVDQRFKVSFGSVDTGHQVGVVKRQLARLIMDADTIRRLAQIDHGAPSSEDWTLSPKLTLRGFSGQGLDWLYRGRSPSGWHWEGGVQWLRLARLDGRELDGTLAYQAQEQTYAFEVQSTQIGSRLRLPFQSAPEASGQGLLLQARAGWQAGSMSGSVGVRDLGWLRWGSVPRQVLQLNSNTQQRDANGYVIYQPLIQGQNSQPKVRWSAPWSLEVESTWRVQGYRQVTVLGQYVPDFGWLPAVRWSDQVGPVRWSAQWRQHQQDVVAQLQWRGWAVALSSENFKAQATSQLWALSYLQAF